MALPVHRHYSADKAELFISQPVKKGDIVKPHVGQEARMKARPADRTTKGKVFVVGFDSPGGEVVDCYDWIYIFDENVTSGSVLLLQDEGKYKVAPAPVKGSRVIGETLDGGVLFAPNASW